MATSVEQKYNPGEHKIFVASSLLLNKQRQVVQEAIDEFNHESKECPITFSCVEYENYPTINQKIEREDAQEPIDRLLRESSIFFLIIEHDIKPLTFYEFDEALNRFRNDKLPRYIFIFRAKEKDETIVKNDELTTITYEDLLDKCALTCHNVDTSGELVPHFKVYDIPFDDIDSLKTMIKIQLSRLPSKLPPAKAKLGKHLDLEDFYSNSLRKKHSPKQFYYRKYDDELREEMRHRKMVLVTGYSLSGKTRSVMEALKEVYDGGWVYAIGDRNDYLIEELKMLKKYVQTPEHLKLCVEIDNMDQLVSDEEEAVWKALREFVDVIMGSGCEDMLVATASDYNTVNDGLQLEGYDRSNFSHIKIPPLRENELHDAIAWFRSCGVTDIADSKTSFEQLGALFVDLNELRLNYENYIKGDKVIRPALLKAIKAQSIWRDDSFGNKVLLQSMTEYFVQMDYGDEYRFRTTKYNRAEKALCQKGSLGVTTTKTGSRLNIEEYVYQYVIGYDGHTTINDTCREEQVKMEKDLIEDIIGYCLHQQEKSPDQGVGKEPLTLQVSRIVRRCNFPRQLTPWLYGLWYGNTDKFNNKREEELAIILQEDRIKCESQPELIKHSYSGLVAKYLKTTHSFDEALCVYGSVREELRVPELFGALMFTGKRPEERERIRKHSDYGRFEKNPHVVLAEMSWTDNYTIAKELFLKAENIEEDMGNVDLARKMLDPEIKTYDHFLRRMMLYKLSTKVHAEVEFTDYCDLLRDNFIYLITDRKLLADIRDGNVEITKNKLTPIDVLAALGWWLASECAIEVYGDDLQSCVKLELELLHCVESALKNKLTNELQIRLVVSTICSKLIGKIAGKTDYFDVYDLLFAPLKIDHPLKEGSKMILRNTYTYTAMMDCRGMDARMVLNMFSNDLVPHAHDADNPLSVNIFTVNKMLGKCRGEKSTYIDQINNLYDQLGLNRDIFSYNNLIFAAPNLNAIRDIMNMMRERNVSPDIYTYLDIQRNNDVDFQTALRIIYSGDCPIEGYHPRNSLPDFLANITPQIQKSLHQMPQAWGNLFEKKVENEEDINAYKLCLKHLRDKHPEMLADNRMYNVVLRNGSFINTIEDAVNYIQEELEPNGFVPDGYTAEALLTKVYLLRGIDRGSASNVLNKFIASHPNCHTQGFLARRISLFRKQDHSIEFVFFDDEKKRSVNRKFSPIRYLKQMVYYNYPLNSYVITNFLNIKGIRTEKTYDNLAEILAWQENKGFYEPKAEDIRIVRELILPYCDNLPEVYKRTNPMESNKTVAWNFKKSQGNRRDKIIAKKTLDAAIVQLDWNDSNSALFSLTEMLDFYVENMRDSDLMKGKMWQTIKQFYDTYIINNGRCGGPTSFTFNLLAKSLVQGNDKGKKWLFSELKKYNGQVSITPHILGELARTVSTVGELVKQTQAIEGFGCKPNANTIDTYVFWLNSKLLNTPVDDNAKPILASLLHHYFGEPDNTEPTNLCQEGHVYLLKTVIDNYEDLPSLSAGMLHSLLSFNLKAGLYPHSFLAQKISENCTDRTVSNLMYRLVDDKGLAHEYVPLLFDRPRIYPSKVLRFLSSPEQLPSRDIEKYNDFLEKLYTFNCPLPESVVPNLLRCLSGYDWEPWIIERLLFVYVDITKGFLRQGNMLMQPERLPDEYATWCHPSVDCVDIREMLDKEKLCAYPVLLRLSRLLENVDFDREGKLFKAFHRAEEIYTNRISEWEIGVEELAELPQLWQDNGWKPSKELALAVVRAYSRLPHHAAQYIAGLSLVLANAIQRGYTVVKVNYNLLGNCVYDEDDFVVLERDSLNNAMPHPFIMDLCYTMHHSRCNFIRIRRDETDFIKSIEDGEISPDIFESLPTLLSSSRYRMSKELESILKDWLSQKGYVQLLRYIGQIEQRVYQGSPYLKEVLLEAEKAFAVGVKDMPLSAATTIEELDGLPELWKQFKIRRDYYWNPSQDLIVAIICFYANIPDVASRQIESVWGDINKARQREKTWVRYASLGTMINDAKTYVPVLTEAVKCALPHPYIIDLCLIANRKKIDEEQTRDDENDYLDHIKKKTSNSYQLIRLHKLWEKARWTPSDELKQVIEDRIRQGRIRTNRT